MKMAKVPNKYIKVLAGVRNGSLNGLSATRMVIVTGGKNYPEDRIQVRTGLIDLWSRQ
jgi:hypothetical protein